MARIKLNTLSEKINKSVPAIQLPRTSIHDAYCLDFKITIQNAGTAAATPAIADVLAAVDQIVLTSDSTRVHYSLNGLDVARRNALFGASDVDKVIEKTLSSIAASASADVEFTLFLDEGDIVAVAHDSLELKVTFGSTAGTNLNVTAADVTTTIVEKIPTGTELIQMYGQNFEYVAEPKVYAITTTIPANTEFTGVLDLPTGTLLTGAMLYFSAAPQQVGILQTVPDRSELIKINWRTMRAIDERKYKTAMPAGMVTLEYGVQWYDNGLGVPAWTYNKGDRQVGVKSPAQTTLRYVSFERMVDTATYTKTGIVNIGGSFV
ncbi:hypothetical protein [Methanofollis ethanolicus]|uniref:hypothetical protein n=1 Tax=Methanofollis ethanolicus TaxID=488124 RepID=UPI000836334C|nr:hypothetical protein [Methanofollis ethanolicus]